MKLFSYGKDGGPYSTVHGFWFIEIKKLFSIVLLRFENGSREAYHSHAFNSISWLIKGQLVELLHGEEIEDFGINYYKPSLKPIFTYRNTFHKVISNKTSWVISFRGPWAKTWEEYLPDKKRYITLEDGRKEIYEELNFTSRP